jgi:hypothetical protein
MSCSLADGFIRLAKLQDMPLPACEYRPRRPQDSDYYRCVEGYL